MCSATPPVADVLPPRIWVVGPCGSGKSTVAAKLAARVGVEPTHLDEIHWRPDWVEVAPEVEREAVDTIVEGPTWVVDGNYTRLQAPHRDEVELFVWLDLPLRVTLTRLLKRGLHRALWRVPVCNGNYESLRGMFYNRDSLLLYAVQNDARRRRQLTRDMRGRHHVRLRSQRAIDAWLRSVGVSEGA